MRIRPVMMLCVLAASIALQSAPADAGCGCAKPPPLLQTVRPAFASPGDTVTLFPPTNRSGRYEVRFEGGSRFRTDAVYKRDLADGQHKWQLVVRAPLMHPGPMRIKVEGPQDQDDFTVGEADFTLMQPALPLREGDGETIVKCYAAAVTTNNVVLIPLDISAISDHMIFNGLGEGYPLLFGAADVMIYNTQGFLMQLLTPANTGIYAIEDPGNPDSLALTYDRHEFDTYRQQHAHVGGLGLDSQDHAWHVDGTYHVDHDHLVLAIKGTVENQGPPSPGRTPRFDFKVTTALADTNGGAPTVRTINACGW